MLSLPSVQLVLPSFCFRFFRLTAVRNERRHNYIGKDERLPRGFLSQPSKDSCISLPQHTFLDINTLGLHTCRADFRQKKYFWAVPILIGLYVVNDFRSVNRSEFEPRTFQTFYHWARVSFFKIPLNHSIVSLAFFRKTTNLSSYQFHHVFDENKRWTTGSKSRLNRPAVGLCLFLDLQSSSSSS